VHAGDSERAKAVFLEAVLRGDDTETSNASDLSSLRRVLPLCSLLCPVTICYGEKQHYVICMSSTCDPLVLENAEAVVQLTKQIHTDSEDVGETMTWIAMHLPSDFLQVTRLFYLCILSSLLETLMTAAAAADKPARRLRNVRTVYVRAVGL